MVLTLRPGHRYALLPFVLLLLQACSSMPQHALQARSATAGSRTTIFVARRGWHIDVGFRIRDLQVPLATLSPQLARSQYVFFGFGDRHYLVARNKNFPGLFAALWPGAGVVLVTMLAVAPGEAFGNEHVIPLAVSSEEARRRRHSRGIRSSRRTMCRCSIATGLMRAAYFLERRPNTPLCTPAIPGLPKHCAPRDYRYTVAGLFSLGSFGTRRAASRAQWQL